MLCLISIIGAFVFVVSLCYAYLVYKFYEFKIPE